MKNRATSKAVTAENPGRDMGKDSSDARAGSAAKPWFKQLWPWLLMLPPVLSVIGGIGVLCVAARTNDGLVAEDYYQRGVTINERLARERSGAQCAAKDFACAAARSREAP